jgi:hypothetical protein
MKRTTRAAIVVSSVLGCHCGSSSPVTVPTPTATATATPTATPTPTLGPNPVAILKANPNPNNTTFHWGQAITLKMTVGYDLSSSGGCVSVNAQGGDQFPGNSLYPPLSAQEDVKPGSGELTFTLSGTVPSQTTFQGKTEDVQILFVYAFAVANCNRDYPVPAVYVQYPVEPK